MHRTRVPSLIVLLLLFCLLGLSSARGAVDLTTPVVIPAKQATKAQIVEIRLRFYTDGQNMLFAPVAQTQPKQGEPPPADEKPKGTAAGYIEWRVGNGDAPNFATVLDGQNLTLTAEDLAAIIALSKAATVAEPLVPALGETPVDKLFVAIIQYLKSKGKL